MVNTRLLGVPGTWYQVVPWRVVPGTRVPGLVQYKVPATWFSQVLEYRYLVTDAPITTWTNWHADVEKQWHDHQKGSRRRSDGERQSENPTAVSFQTI